MFARTPEDAVRLVRRFERGDGTEALAARIEAAMRRFPPDECDMQRLSLLQQACAEMHDERAYCTTMLYAIAQVVVADTPPPPPPPPPPFRRVRSAGGGVAAACQAPRADASAGWWTWMRRHMALYATVTNVTSSTRSCARW